ncbi:MAG: dockerin type I repeat-containing protein [Lachnospirales bacterium]
MTYEGAKLTKAIKVNSKTSFTFEAPTDGVLTLVMEAKADSSVKINGVSVNITTGINTIPVKAGTNTVTKGKNETHLYLAQYGVSDEPTTETTTNTAIETTTNAVDTTTEVTTDKATETTTEDINPDKPKLSDDIMWAVDVDLVESNGLTVGEPFLSNSEEDSPAKFSNGKNTYELSDWVQPKGNPYGEDDTNPVNTTGIPVKGGYVKFTPSANGAFTMAVKTGSGKITYVTDENGKLVTKIDNTGKTTSYDILSINVSSDKTYYVFAGGSKICLYYLGFTAGKTVPATEFVYGDVDGNGKREISDVNMLIEQISKGKVNKVKGINDVNEDGVVDSADVAVLLQKILNDSYKMPCESNNPIPTPVEPTTEATTAKVETTTVKTDVSTETTTQAIASDDYFNFDNSPAITKDGTSGITYTVSTKSGQTTDNLTAEAVITDYNGSKVLHLNDQSTTDTIKANIPLTEKNSGTVTYTAKITPTVAKGSWTVFMLNGVKADDTEGEVLGLRIDGNKNYGLRVNGGSAVTATTTAVSANTAVTVVITVDFDNDKATLTVNGGTPVTVTGVDAKSIKSMAFQTATDARSLYIDDAGIIG